MPGGSRARGIHILISKDEHMTGFSKVRSQTIPTLQATIEEYAEFSTGARHIHLNTTGGDWAFLVALPTVPDVDDGRAHILAHLALCGSQRYPGKDPFFSMMRRSTATFMNAMTYADRTVYPFASTSEKDFANLLDVYLDAVFVPRLDYLNFLQEGWRYTLTDGKLGYQGVVLNEMKGAFIAPSRALYRGISSALLQGTTYEVESGGDPLAIPQLTHAMLTQFHASHYHPSQAAFMTAGPMSAQMVQQQIAERVLAKLPGRHPRMVPQLAALPDAPLRNTVSIPSQEARENEFGVQLTWLMGESANQKAAMDATLLSAGLLGDAAAPLVKAMETAGYGRPSQINGFDNGARQILFHLGMEGLTEQQVADAEQHILQALAQVARDGVPRETLQATLRDLKYTQRDTSSYGMPNILQRMLVAVPLAMREGDVFSAFDTDTVLQGLENDIADPAYFKGLVQAMLESPARLVTKVVPDAAYFAKREQVELHRLADRQASLSDEDRDRISTESALLAAHQQQPVNTEALPRIKPSDVSAIPRAMPAIDRGPVHAYSIGSNGISSASVVYDVSGVASDDWPWLALYAGLRTDLGVQQMSYDEAGAWRQRMVPWLGVELQAYQATSGALNVDLIFSANALREEHASIAAVLKTYIQHPRFDEHTRLAYLIHTQFQNKLNGIAETGSHYAALAGSAPLSAARRFDNETTGAPALAFYARLQKLAKTAEGLAVITAELERIHGAIVAIRPDLICAGSESDGQALAALLGALVTDAAIQAESGRVAPPSGLPLANVALHAPSQVNHCTISWAVPQVHGDNAAELAVAAELLTSQVLHQALREAGGAYGGSASYAGDVGVFAMTSYRDPRLAATYDDFAAAFDQLLTTDYSAERIEEAIIGVIKKLDQPDSPWAAVRAAWSLHRRGVDDGARQRFRSGVLGCTQARLKDAVRLWLKDAQPSRAAFVGNAGQDLAGLEVVDLGALAS
jgi:Zn-dependent M16 (insulinase) family peptidase